FARVASHEERRVDRLDQRAVRLRGPEALAPADHAVVGADLDEAAGAHLPEPLGHAERLVESLDDDVGDDGGDLHGGALLGSQGAVTGSCSGSARPMGVRVIVSAIVVPSRRKTPATTNAAV